MEKRNRHRQKFVQQTPMEAVFRASAQYFSDKYRAKRNPALLMAWFDFDEDARKRPDTSENAQKFLALFKKQEQMDR